MAVKKCFMTVDDEGTIRWYKDAECTVLHQENGHAVKYADGTKEWYIDGVKMTEDAFLAENARAHNTGVQ